MPYYARAYPVEHMPQPDEGVLLACVNCLLFSSNNACSTVRLSVNSLQIPFSSGATTDVTLPNLTS
jgi:hypothetical protein